MLLSVLIWLAVRPGPPAPRRGEFGDVVRETATGLGVPPGHIEADVAIRKVEGVFVRAWRVGVPDCATARRLAAELARSAVAWGGTVRTEAAGGCAAGTIRVDLGIEELVLDARPLPERPTSTPRPPATPTPTPRPTLPPGRRGHLAILLDDAGQSLELVPRLARLPRPVAVAVLPFLPASVETAARLDRAGHEVWLHLPMEPEGYPRRDPGPGAILVALPEAEIRARVRAALNNVPYVVGVNNHMGSRATADLRVMTWVMQEIAARGLVFLDSRTTRATVAEVAARAQGVPAWRRHVFLDNSRDAAAIRRALAEAVYRARRDGAAVAIGHANPATVAVLERELPRLAGRGADLVPPAELIRRRAGR